MAYGETKVYYDGSHYIAIPHTERPKKPKALKIEKEIVVNDKNEIIPEYDEIPSMLTLSNGHVLEEVEFVDGELKPVIKKVKRKGKKTTKKALFEQFYRETLELKKKERRQVIIDGMKALFKTIEDTERYVDDNLERKQRNLIARRIRLTRKANLQEFNYFCTFTYDDKKHSEDSFKKVLKNCFYHLANRKGWRYIGVWERSPEKKRLHFHGVFYIPSGTMPGKLIPVNDYSFKTHKRQITIQNTYFNEKYGRSDFEEIEDKGRMGEALAYLMKYIEKTGEKIVYSRGLPQYFISDIMDEDIACPIGVDNQKLLLFDDFKCWDEGTLMGTVNKETIKEMRKAN